MRIDIIGLGQIGLGVAKNLRRNGYQVIGIDTDAKARQQADDLAIPTSTAVAALPEPARLQLVCLPSPAAIAYADRVLITSSEPDTTVIDLSTMPAPENRRIGHALAGRSVSYLDAPVSGGKGGADSGKLRVFVGGDMAVYEQFRSVLEAFGDPSRIGYFGPQGSGQIAKVVQQLSYRWPDVARLEVMAFGVNAGLDLEQVMTALGVDSDGDDPYARIYSLIREGRSSDLHGLFSEWDYYLEEAVENDIPMPMLTAMRAFAEEFPRNFQDNMGRPVPSLWQALIKANNLPKHTKAINP